MSYKSYKELNVWKKSRELRSAIFILCQTFPSEEKYKLSDQLIRCSRSVTANLAEGHGRHHFQEYIQFCRMSRGSLLELTDHLTVAADCNYITSEKLEELNSLASEVHRLLNGYINYLKKLKLTEKVK